MTKFGEALIESLGDALAHARGEASGVRTHAIEVTGCAGNPTQAAHVPAGVCQHLPDPAADAEKLGAGPAFPDAPAAAYLLTIARLPTEVGAALARTGNRNRTNIAI